MPKHITATIARDRFGEVLDNARKGEVIIIEQDGDPVAAVVPIEQYRQWQQAREEFFALVEKAQARMRRYPPDEMEQLIQEAVESARVRT